MQTYNIGLQEANDILETYLNVQHDMAGEAEYVTGHLDMLARAFLGITENAVTAAEAMAGFREEGIKLLDKIEDENNEEEYKEELKSKLREDLIQFTLNGLSYTDSKGNLAYVDKSDYVSPTNPANIGTKGWIDDFISRVEELNRNTYLEL